MDIEYIIVQAGGKGSRLEYLTENKPKSLVPINNLPMIFHLFNKYPNKKFIIIGDYKYEVLKKYLYAFAQVDYLLVNANGYTGTCAGIKEALKYIPENSPFLIIWSDLILPMDFTMPDYKSDIIGLSKDFSCRWKYENNQLAEMASSEFGVAGFFIFISKASLIEVPIEGEFVRWLQSIHYEFNTIELYKTKEYGLLSEYKKLEKSICRPFNRLEKISDELILKEGIDEQGKRLAVNEKQWYEFVEKLGYINIPQIVSYNPFIMEKINGKNIYEYNFTKSEKIEILSELIRIIKDLHSLDKKEVDYFSLKDAYFVKTIKRLEKVRDLIPFADKETIMINGKLCKNIYFFKDELELLLDKIECNEFVLLHGDCTFSNIMLKQDKYPILIDPRGYFGKTKLYGDSSYDWAKLYYSLVGNYDQFNRKNFRLHILNGEVKLDIETNNWEDFEDEFFNLINDCKVSKEKIKLIHAIIWLSLTTYAWEDYDSICGAFYNGLYYLSEFI